MVGLGRPGSEPLREQRELFAQLIAPGVDNGEAFRQLGVNRRTGTRWRFRAHDPVDFSCAAALSSGDHYSASCHLRPLPVRGGASGPRRPGAPAQPSGRSLLRWVAALPRSRGSCAATSRSRVPPWRPNSSPRSKEWEGWMPRALETAAAVPDSLMMRRAALVLVTATAAALWKPRRRGAARAGSSTPPCLGPASLAPAGRCLLRRSLESAARTPRPRARDPSAAAPTIHGHRGLHRKDVRLCRPGSPG